LVREDVRGGDEEPPSPALTRSLSRLLASRRGFGFGPGGSEERGGRGGDAASLGAVPLLMLLRARAASARAHGHRVTYALASSTARGFGACCKSHEETTLCDTPRKKGCLLLRRKGELDWTRPSPLDPLGAS